MGDLAREQFKEIVYDLLSDDDSNFRANMIIDAADEYAEYAAKEALKGNDTNVPTNSALDHIHNVVKDDAYKRGYKDGRKDAIPLEWIESYIETCNMFQLRVSVPVSKIISAMVKTWEQENPRAKRGEEDGNN